MQSAQVVKGASLGETVKSLEKSSNQNHATQRQFLLKTAALLALLMFGIELGVSYSHMMQWVGKAQLSLTAFIAVQTILIKYKVGLGVVEIGSFVLLFLMLYLSHPKSPQFRLTLAAMVFLIVAFLVWAVLIEPINAAIDTWTSSSHPADWTQYRERWHLLHLVRLLLLTAGMASLAGSTLTKDF